MNFKAVVCTFDLETGGLVAKDNQMVEIAMCPFRSDTLVDLNEYNSIIAPYGDYTIDDRALAANGMTREQIFAGRDSKLVLNDIIDQFNKMKIGKEKPILAGHNIISFDIPFLEEFFRFHGKSLFDYINNNFFLDTMWIGRLRWLESVNYKLGTCCSNANIELVNAHRAVADTRANKELVKYFIKNLRNESVDSKVSEKRFRENFTF